MSNFKVDREPAENDFYRWANDMDLDISPKNSDEKDSIADHKETIVDAIMKGHLVINDNGEAVYTPYKSEDKEKVTFYEPDGSCFAKARIRENPLATMYGMMANITKESSAKFMSMRMADLRVCESIFMLLRG